MVHKVSMAYYLFERLIQTTVSTDSFFSPTNTCTRLLWIFNRNITEFKLNFMADRYLQLQQLFLPFCIYPSGRTNIAFRPPFSLRKNEKGMNAYADNIHVLTPKYIKFEGCESCCLTAMRLILLAMGILNLEQNFHFEFDWRWKSSRETEGENVRRRKAQTNGHCCSMLYVMMIF